MAGRSDFGFLGEIGRGSFAVVYKVRRKSDRKLFVCKQVSLAHFSNEKSKARALSEASILKQCSCPHIVEYIDAFIEMNQLHLVIQYCQGGDLKSFLSRSAELPTKTIWRMGLRVNLGLRYLHGRRILHRDLKTENVFLTGSDSVRIGDLGLGRMLTNTQTGTSTLVGTPRYFSPEEAGGAQHYSEKCDMWALGVTFYELCSPKHRGPFDKAQTLPELLNAIINEEPPTLPDRLDPRLLEATALLLCKTPEGRPSAPTFQDTFAAEAQLHAVHEAFARERGASVSEQQTPEQRSAASAARRGNQPSQGQAGGAGGDKAGRERAASSAGSRQSSQGSDMSAAGGSPAAAPTPSAATAARAGQPALPCPPAKSGTLLLPSQSATSVRCRAASAPPAVGGMPPVAPTEVQIEVPDSMFSRMCDALYCKAKEPLLGPRFHRLGVCELCVAEGSARSGFGIRVQRRRHHCRCCGRTVCSKHSLHRRVLPTLELETPQRICDFCAFLPSMQGEGTPQPLVVAAGAKAYVWDYKAGSSPKLRAGEQLCWAGLTSGASGEALLCTLDAGAAFDLTSLQKEKGCELVCSAQLPKAPLFTGPSQQPAASSTSPGPGSKQASKAAPCEYAFASSSGKLLAVAYQAKRGSPVSQGQGCRIHIAEMPEGRCAGKCQLLEAWLQMTSMALQATTDKNAILAVGAQDGAVRIWSAPGCDDQCSLICVLHGHRAPVLSLAFAGNGAFLCSGSKDNSLRLWRQPKPGALSFEANASSEIDDYRWTGSSSLFCDGSYLAYVRAPLPNAVGHGVSLWNLVLRKWERSFYRRDHSARCIALCGALLATTSGHATHRGCEVQLWLASTGDALAVIMNPEPITRLLIAGG